MRATPSNQAPTTVDAALARETVEALQVAWQKQDWDTVGGLFHADALLLPPDLGPTICSRDAIIASYQEFMAQARVHQLTMTHCNVQPFERSCMVQCEFDIDYSLGDARADDQLTEIYLLECAGNGAMQIVWRQQIIQSMHLPSD